MTAVFVPMPSFLNDLSAGSKNEGLALNFVSNGVFDAFQRVHVLGFGSGAEFLGAFFTE